MVVIANVVCIDAAVLVPLDVVTSIHCHCCWRYGVSSIDVSLLCFVVNKNL